MPFVLAHISDFHCPFPVRVRAGEVLNKRILGLMNLRLRRQRLHRPDTLSTLLLHLAAQQPDFTAVTGDLVNLGLDEEFRIMADLLASSGLDPARTAIVPGNHDRYVAAAQGALERHLAAWLPEPLPREGYPQVWTAGPLDLVGISSAVPRSFLRSAGRIGSPQIERLTALLDRLPREGRSLVVLCHHPPFRYARPLKQLEAGLEDIGPFLAPLAGRSALVLSGHTHRFSHRWIGSKRDIRSIGVPSASRASEDVAKQAAYHLYTFDGPVLTGAVRCRLDPSNGNVIQEPIPEPSQPTGAA